MKTWIHVNQNKIRQNLKHGTNEPTITVKQGKKNIYCRRVMINGPCEVISSGNDKPLISCGARVAILTNSPIKVLE